PTSPAALLPVALRINPFIYSPAGAATADLTPEVIMSFVLTLPGSLNSLIVKLVASFTIPAENADFQVLPPGTIAPANEAKGLISPAGLKSPWAVISKVVFSIMLPEVDAIDALKAPVPYKANNSASAAIATEP